MSDWNKGVLIFAILYVLMVTSLQIWTQLRAQESFNKWFDAYSEQTKKRDKKTDKPNVD